MRTLIVDDHSLFADALSLALEANGLSVCKATTGAQALERIAVEDFDLILLDLNLPDVHGEVLLSSIKQANRDCKVIAVSSVNADIARISSLGANGFISKAENIDTMLRAIRTVLAGGAHFDESAGQTSEDYLLTPRQLDIVKAMCEGLANKKIAHSLNITEGTVKQQINRIFKVLDVENRTQCVRKAERLGLVG